MLWHQTLLSLPEEVPAAAEQMGIVEVVPRAWCIIVSVCRMDGQVVEGLGSMTTTKDVLQRAIDTHEVQSAAVPQS